MAKEVTTIITREGADVLDEVRAKIEQLSTDELANLVQFLDGVIYAKNLINTAEAV